MKKVELSKQLRRLAAIYNVYKFADLPTRSVRCCTCGIKLPLNPEDPDQDRGLWGHFIPRSKSKFLTYHPWNSAAQCSKCNVQREGNEEQFEIFIYQQYGEKALEYLKQEKEQKTILDSYELEDYLEQYKKLLEELAEEKQLDSLKKLL